MTKKVFVEGPDYLVTQMFEEEGWEAVYDIADGPDLIVLEGGADISPSMYNEEDVGSYHTNTNRDLMTMGLIAAAQRMSIPIVGICRGAQMLNIYFKGSMVQHLEDHGYDDHSMFYEGKDVEVTSAHHQAMVLNDEHVANAYYSDDGIPELVHWNDGPVGVQYHPEYVNKGHPCRDLFFSLISRANWKSA